MRQLRKPPLVGMTPFPDVAHCANITLKWQEPVQSAGERITL